VHDIKQQQKQPYWSLHTFRNVQI